MSGYTELHPLVESVLEELERLRYADETVTAYRRLYANLERYADSIGAEGFSEGLAVSFINDKFGTSIEGLYQARPERVYMRSFLRGMRVLLEWDLCGCVCKRVAGQLKLTDLPKGLQLLLDSFNAECRANGLSESTVYSRNNRIKHFLIFLADAGGSDAGCITESSAHDYILTKASTNPKSVQSILTAIRCFYRHLYLAGLVGRDLTATVPSPKSHYAPELPGTWTASDVDALLASIDRGSPIGKRDYAMLLMVARLGLRASDIKSLRIDGLDWDARRISITQHKTGVPLALPLLDDVGWAVIDYLRGGRPAGATCPELFVRHNAPFEPFGSTSNLTYILSNRARAAGVKTPSDRKTLHSLRHALARRLLEQSVPIDDISRILGHVNKRTTSIYLRM
ncbi:MAG: tyrosine-type recombinase/integrase, partial [Atopobiaceae bacterium]|nr:tyrosine-type recombinase/integrase [Atopobiaceae bacterium]